jgi:hypothetical protein
MNTQSLLSPVPRAATALPPQKAAQGGLSFSMLGRAEAMTLPSGAATVMAWDTEVTDGLDCWSIADPSRLVFAGPRRWIRFSCGMVWPARDDQTVRQVWLAINGDNYPLGYASHTVHGGHSNGSSTSITAISGPISLGEGDTAQLMVFQASGSPMTLSPKNSRWLCAEALN